jgi:IS30 family transposase
MPRSYRQLNVDERHAIFRLLNAKLPIAEIANRLDRHREIRRNRLRDVKEYHGYYPVTADITHRSRTRSDPLGPFILALVSRPARCLSDDGYPIASARR